MQYKRTFHISAAHFNNQKCYDTVWAWVAAPVDTAGYMDKMFNAMYETHGHNFKIEICVAGKVSKDWLIDDVKLEQVVMEWSNINLSVHTDFLTPRLRATTEHMARILRVKLDDEFGNELIAGVTVHETSDISASIGVRA